jgi:hypothetical protein
VVIHNLFNHNNRAIRAAIADGTVSAEAEVDPEVRSSPGQISMIENIIDATTGLATVRATMPNRMSCFGPGRS